MSQNSKIQWTDATWNIARGCTKVDADCKYCYMYRDAARYNGHDPAQVIRTKTVFNMPLKLKEPSRIFTCSLTDFFHEDIDSYRHEAWDIIRQCPQHTFQILTKRPERILQSLPDDWGFGWDNVWLGTSVGSNKAYHRIEQLAMMETDCIKFLSLEPLHGPVDLIYKNVPIIHPDNEGYGVEIIKAFDWVIVGGESGNDTGKYRYRECQLSWIEEIVNDCQDAHVPVFVKQMGTYLAKQMGLSRHGGDMSEWPAHLQIRQFPTLYK